MAARAAPIPHGEAAPGSGHRTWLRLAPLAGVLIAAVGVAVGVLGALAIVGFLSISCFELLREKGNLTRQIDAVKREHDLQRAGVVLAEHRGHRREEVLLLVEDRHHDRDARQL